MPKSKEGAEYVCDVCGATLLVVEPGCGCMEELICCSQPMKPKTAKKKAKPKKK